MRPIRKQSVGILTMPRADLAPCPVLRGHRQRHCFASNRQPRRHRCLPRAAAWLMAAAVPTQTPSAATASVFHRLEGCRLEGWTALLSLARMDPLGSSDRLDPLDPFLASFSDPFLNPLLVAVFPPESGVVSGTAFGPCGLIVSIVSSQVGLRLVFVLPRFISSPRFISALVFDLVGLVHSTPRPLVPFISVRCKPRKFPSFRCKPSWFPSLEKARNVQGRLAFRRLGKRRSGMQAKIRSALRLVDFALAVMISE